MSPTLLAATFDFESGDIVVPSAAVPPANAAQGVSLLVDGRIDNGEELASALGLEFLNDGPNALLRTAWGRWNEGLFDRLVGDFAIAVLDLNERAVWLSRDPAGARPLYFRKNGSQLCLASRPGDLYERGEQEADLIGLANMLAGSLSSKERTTWLGCRLVTPGTTMRIDLQGSRTNDLLGPERFPLRSGEQAELAEELSATMSDAVACRLSLERSELTATHLSSGFDSNAVTATAAKKVGPAGSIIAFTSAPVGSLPQSAPSDRIADESEIAAKAARSLGVRHVIVRDKTRMLTSIRGKASRFQEPVGNPFNFAWWMALHRAAADHGANRILSGQHGNATISFGGLPVLPAWLAHRGLLEWIRQCRATTKAGLATWKGALFTSASPWLPPALAKRLLQLRQHGISLRDDHLRFVRTEYVRTAQMEERSEPALHADPRLNRLAILRNYDGRFGLKAMQLETGVEELDPTGDRRLVELTMTLPPETLLQNGVAKPLFRMAFEGTIPNSILKQRIRGFQGADWIGRINQAEALEAVEDISASSSASELLDVEKLRQAALSWPDPEGSDFDIAFPSGRALTSALSVGLFLAETERHGLETL